MDRYFGEGLTYHTIVLQVAWLTNRHLTARGTKSLINCSLVRSIDRYSQDKVGSLVQFAKTDGSRNLVELILTHVYPFNREYLAPKFTV